ncbi:MAG TPA: hypothetical protein VGR45_17255, partial [Stellaceae bacterium]|nr:hypothetical protein [Stellaceae bacterium]
MRRAFLLATLTLAWASPSHAQRLFPIQQSAVTAAGPANTLTLSNQSGGAITNYPLQFGRPFLDGAIPSGQCIGAVWTPTGVSPIGLSTQADTKNHYPDGSVEFAVLAVIIPSIPAGGSGVLSFGPVACQPDSGLSQAQMEALLPVGAAILTLTDTASPPNVYGTADAGQMLLDGNCQPWTQGPNAETEECADDTPARKYDIGFGDGYHPFRPRFYVTFWPGTGQVRVRAVGESGLSTEIEDLAYKFTLTSSGTTIYSGDLSGTQASNPKVHWAGSRWSRSFWIGGTPSAQVNIDNNLAYLESTRFLPNFDTAITVSPSAIATEYANYAQNANDIYDGLWDQPTNSTSWQSAMPSTGARQDIAPYPAWTALWLYTGDWRMRQVALGLADQAASWPMHVRETDPTKRFLITDPVPGASGTGSGYGLPISHADRQSAFGQLTTSGNGLFNWGNAADNLKAVSASVDKGDPWGWDGAHQPSAFFPQYILTGDPFYLEEMTFWASITAFNCWGGTNNIGQGCGPYPSTAVYGGAIHDQLRGDAWTLR